MRLKLQSSLGAAYTLERELGGGGMSRVFVAEEAALGRQVVVKVLPSDLSAGVNVERFKREIQVSAKLQHPHIVPVLSTGEMDGVPYYTMPFVEGESLRARLIRVGALSITEGIGILRDVAKALAYAHDHRVVHRDIKPDNILLSGGSATVADFGIAKAISVARDDAPGGTLTQVGTSLGTPAYMAPEQAAADPATNHRADIYAFGCVAYEVLTGRPPFVAKTPQRLLAAQMGEKPQAITELRPDLPTSLADLVMKCLEKDADARPQSAAELVRVLETVTSGGGHAALPPILLGGPGMFRRALAYYAAAFFVVLIVAQAAVIGIGLPQWVLPGATILMLMGLPVILFTAYVQRVARRAITMTPSLTPGGTPSLTHGTMAIIAIKASPHVSWRRAGIGGAYAIGAFVLLVGGFMVLRALGIGPAGSLFAAGKLDRNERLLVTDFGVKGNADTTLGGVVSEALRTDLGQSDVLRLVTASNIRDALQRMRRPATSRIDATLAREIAQREGIKVIVDGDVTPLGAGFLVTARLVTAETGDELASFREIADGPRDLIAAIEKLSRSLRGKIGESLKTVNATPALAQVSTASLEALRKYVEGVRAVDIEADEERGVVVLKEAVALDSAFAMAWRKLAVAYGNSGFGEQADSAAARAYRYRDRLTEIERFQVSGYYFAGPGRDRGRAAQAYEALTAKGIVGANATNLAGIYASRREFARAESLARRRIAELGSPFVTHANLVAYVFQQGKIAEAESLAANLRKSFPNVPQSGVQSLAFLYHRGEIDSLLTVNELHRRSRDAQLRANAHGGLAAIQQLRGHLGASLRTRLEQRAIDSARGIPVGLLGPSLDSAYFDIWYRDNSARGIGRLDAALARTPLRTLPRPQRPYFQAARLYALGGRPDKARAVLSQYDAEVRDTTIRRSQRPGFQSVSAEVALAERKAQEAIRELRASMMLPDGPAGPCVVCDAAALGRAFDHAEMPDSAIAYFEQFTAGIQFQRWGIDANVLPPILKRLGELYEARGERQKAYASYARFVELWRNADPDLQPKVQEVRGRMARLKDVERN
ncbi:MAG: protein kinase [Gemmatimonadaceae bacterium]